MTIAGSPAASTTGRAYVTNVAGGPQVVLRPYKFNSTNNVDRTDFETSEVEFGRGPEVISDGFYLVGNTSPIDSNQYVYNFRQRGPAWSPGALTVAAPLSTAKLGAAVAIAGTTAILGAPDYGNHGTVFVFNQTPNSDPDRDPLWELQSQIEAPGFRTGDKFGASVAINGENLIVGAPGRDIGTNDNAGGAYILRRLSDGWILQAELRGTVVGQEAGTSVDIGAEYAAIGGPSTSTPGVHLFRKIGTEWSADKVITTPQAGNRFGSSVHLSDTTLFVGSPGHNSDTGAVHIYSLAPHPQNVDSNVTSNVDNPGRIDFTGGSVGDEFGASLDGSGRYIVVGAPGTANDTGAAYVFIRPIGSTGWIQTRLDYSNGAVAGDRFGTSIAIDGTQIIVGAPGRTRTTGSDGRTYSEGEAFSYGLKNNGTWTLETPADSSDSILAGARAFAGDNVGYSVAIFGDLAILGAPQFIGRPPGAIDIKGSGYAFVRQVNPPTARILPSRQGALIAGALTNTIGGTVGGVTAPTLQFFDIEDLDLRLSLADDSLGAPIISTVLIRPDGFTAYGLQAFSVTGNIEFTNQAAELSIPTNGQYEYIADRPITGTPPIALDLNGNGLEFVPVSAGVTFDLDGTGAAPTVWLAANDGWLFIELAADGNVTRDELSFAATVPDATSDLAALQSLYDNVADNRLTPADARWADFRVWQDLNQDGLSTPDEVKTLAEMGIVAIGLDSDDLQISALSGAVTVLGKTEFTRSDGSIGTVGDVVLNTTIQLPIEGKYDFNGGPDSVYLADADTDWTLYDNFLTASDGREGVDLKDFNDVVLRGGAGNNGIQVFSWNGNVRIDGRGGSDTIILHAGSGANVVLEDSGLGDELTIIGTNAADQINITETVIEVLPVGSTIPSLRVTLATPPPGSIRVSGGDGDDVISVTGLSARSLNLDGGEGADEYDLQRADSATFTYISDSGANDGTEDMLTVFVDGPTQPNGYADLTATDVKYNNIDLGVDLLFNESIEKFETKSVDPILNLIGNGLFVVTTETVTFNGATHSLSGVTRISITTTGSGSTIDVRAIPPTVECPPGLPVPGTPPTCGFEVNATAGTGDTIMGPDAANTWSINGPDSGSLSGTPNLTFTGVENLIGGSATDLFVFGTAGSISGNLDGGGGDDELDYSSTTTGVTVDLSSGKYTSIETVIGSAGIDELIGPDTGSLWTITGANMGELVDVASSIVQLVFSLIENLTGGAAEDRVVFGTGSTLTGMVGGGGGDNQIDINGDDGVDDVVVVGAPAIVFNGLSTTYARFATIEVSTLGGLDEVTVNPEVAGFPQTVTVATGDDDDEIFVNLVTGAATEINIDGGAPSASDSVRVTGTGDVDVIDVNGLQVTAVATTINLVMVENLTIDGVGEADRLSVTGTGVTGVLALLGGADDDVITLAYPITVGTLTVDGGAGAGDHLEVLLTDDADVVSLDTATIAVLRQSTAGYTGFNTVRIDSGLGADDITVIDTHPGTTAIDTGVDEDQVTIESTSSELVVDTGTENDVVDVRTIGAKTTLNLGEDADRVVVSSTAPTPGGIVAGIAAELIVNGGLGGDTLVVDNAGDSGANTGSLTNTHVMGLEMASGIAYDSIEMLDILLGDLVDNFTIVTTFDNTITTLNSGDGADIIDIEAVNGPTFVDSGDGADVVNVTPSASGPVNSRSPRPLLPSAINARLTLDGGGAPGDVDTFTFTTIHTSAQPGTLTATELTGLQMPLGIGYKNFEALDILTLIDGVEFTIESTHAGTTRLATDSVACDSTAPEYNLSPYDLDSSACRFSFPDPLIEDSENFKCPRGGTLTEDSIPNTTTPDPDDAIVFDRYCILDLGNDNADTITVLSTGGETEIWTDRGADTINVRTVGGATTVRAGDGDDTVNVGSNAPSTLGTLDTISALLTVEGDDGDDTLNVDDTGDPTTDTGSLTSTTIRGLGMSDGIDYGTFETLNIALSAESDLFDVISTHGGVTNITSRAGGDAIIIENISGTVILDTGDADDYVIIRSTNPGSLLIINSGIGVDWISVLGLQGTVILNGGEENDVFEIGSNADATRGVDTGGTLEGIVGHLVIGGDEPQSNGTTATNGAGNEDTLYVDDTGYTADTWALLTSTTLNGLSIRQSNEIQTVVIDAVRGTFSLSFGGETTGALPHDASAGQVEAALSALSGIGDDNLSVTKNDDVYVLRFQGDLTNTDVAEVTTDASGLVKLMELAGGGVATVLAKATLATRVEGGSGTARNDRVAVTVRATGGTFTLWYDINNDGVQDADETTAALAHDATAEAVRVALQTMLAQGDPARVLDVDFRVDRFLVTDADGASLVYLIGMQGALREEPNAPADTPPGADMLFADAGTLMATSPDAASIDVELAMDGITYFGLESVNIATGSGAEIFNVQGTTAGSGGFSASGGVAVTNISLGGGDDRVFVSSTADLDHASAPGFDFLTGNLDDVNGALNIDLGTGRHRLFISDEAAEVADTAVSITDVAPTDAAARQLATGAEIFVTGLAGSPTTLPAGGITYLVDPTGDLFDGVVYWTGPGGDTVTIDGTHLRAGGRTTTMLNTGLGDDEITIDLEASDDGFLVVNASGGSATDDPDAPAVLSEISQGAASDDDTIDATDSTRAVTIFGGFGEDVITGGLSNDIVVGDFGRVQYIIGGVLVATHGFGGRGDLIDSTLVGPSYVMSRDVGLGADDEIDAGEGDNVVLAGFGGDTVDSGSGNDTVVGDNGVAIFDTTTSSGSALVKSVTTSDPLHGGDDEIDAGEGDNVVLAGFGGDTVDSGSGNDTVVGDNGEALFDTTTGESLIDFVETTAPEHGDIDLINAGEGTNVVLGGAGSDVIATGDGADIVLGDNGEASFVIVGGASVLSEIASTDLAIGGDDVILVGDGDDLVVAGSGNDLVNYVFDPVTGLPVQYGTDGGNDIVIGDNGQARFETSTGVALLEMIMTTAPEDGGDDFIFTGDNTDIVFGGSGNDVIDAQTTGNSDGAQDIVVGDNGVAVFDTSGGISRLVAISTSAPESGGQDRIVTGTGDDIVFGGVSEDIIDTSGGDFSDVVVGDNGRAIYVDGVLRSITTSNPGEGQDDYIVTGTGADVVLGGTGDDHIDAGRNAADVERDVVIGDNGLVVFSAFKELLIIRTIDPYSGGKDFILTGGGSDVIFGGSSSDFIMAGSEGDLVLGDNGFASFSDVNGNPGPVYLVYSTAPIAGGHDEIHAGSGDDLVFGGSFNDTIFGGAGNDILLGDHGLFDRSLPRDQQFRSIMTTEYDGGGDDLIYGDFGSGIGTLGYTDFDDVIMGQQGNDELYGGLGDDDITGGHNVVGGVDGDDFIDGEEGADVVLGDNGTIKRILIGVDLDRYLRYPKPFGDVVRSIVRFDDIDKISGNDRIHGGLGRDILHGQRGADRIFGDDGDDNIFGDLGSDFLSGGAGHDVVLAEPGQIVPVFNTDGTPLINADGSWRRDVILEEQGVIVDYINGAISSGTAFSAGVADRLLRADLILIAGIAPMVPTPWDTLLILINFIEASTNEIDGGIGNDLLFGGSAADLIFGNDGNDHIFGGLGNDVLNGGDDNDLVVGDEATNAVLRGYLSRILRGVRLVADLTTAPLGIELGPDGTFVVPQALIRPEMLECAADGAPLAEILTGAAANLGDPLTRKDGSVLAVTIGLHGSLAHNSDRASGNDVIDGGDGDDVLIGDHLVIAQAVPVLDEIVAATARLQAEINRLVAGYARLAAEHDVARNTAQGIRRYHPARLVTSGNDVMRGGHGEDLFTGDHAMLTNVDTTVVTDEETFIGDTLISQQLLEDLIHLSSDVANMVVHARQTVLAVIDPGLVPTLHETTVGNDSIDATVKARVFGDLDPDIISGGNTTYLDTGVTAALTPDMLAAAIEALNTTPASSQHPLIPTTLSVADQDTATVVASTCNPATSADRFVTDDNNNTILAAPATATAPQPLSALVDNEDNSDN